MQNRRVYIDDWCLMEKICLASAVLRFGDSNWSNVCDLIKPRLHENRPWDWFTPETCEAQYKVLFSEFVKSQSNEESPVLQIIQNLKSKCKIECQRKDEYFNKYMTLKKKLEILLKNEVEPDLIEKYYEEVQRDKKEKEERLRKHQETLKKRDILKAEFEKGNVTKTPNKQETKADGGSSPIVTSPLLSSLLNNPPAVQYRPTLSTSSFIPTKTTQSTSRSSSFEKLHSFSTDTSFKDSFSSELSESICSQEKQPMSVASSSSSIKKSESQESIDSLAAVPGNQTPSIDSTSRIQSTTTDTTSKSDTQNLETLGLISSNEEEYFSEVDIPPEALLEVIGDIKKGAISFDKLIRDLEATEEAEIIGKEDLDSISLPLNESYTIENKTIEQAPVVSQPSPVLLNHEVKPEITDDSKIEMNEIEIQPSDTSSSEQSKLDVEEQVVTIEETEKEEIHTTKTVSIANIKTSDTEIPVTKDESPSVSFSSTIAVNVEFDSSFSEQKSDNEMVESQSNKSEPPTTVETEEDDTKVKTTSKPVVVIKRIEDGSYLNKTRKNKTKIPLEESIEEIEDVTCDVEQNQDQKEIPPEREVEVSPRAEIIDKDQVPSEADKQEQIIDGNITLENETVQKEEEIEVKAEPDNTEITTTADDSDTSDKFEDALQTQIEESNETLPTEKVVEAEIEKRSSPYVDVDESFELNLSDEKPEEKVPVENKEIEKELQLEKESVIEKLTPEVVPEAETPQPVETIIEKVVPVENQKVTSDKDIPTSDVKITEPPLRIVEENRKSEDVKPAPTKIIKNLKRKRKSTSETNDTISEMSIVVPSFPLREIETVDSDIEQTFAPVHTIKTEPSDTKPEDERKEKKEEASVAEKSPIIKEGAAARIKSERRDTKTPERIPVMVLRRSANKTQSSFKRSERESRNADNAELIKVRKSILFALSRLSAHKYANAFQKPITNRQVPGYENVIYKPMDIGTIKKKIDNKQISTVSEFQRDVLLMLNNAKMFNRINSQVYNMAVEVQEDALPHIKFTVETLGKGVLRTENTTEKIRKRQSLDNPKKDLKLIKRIKCSTKDDSFSNLIIKKPKLEANEDE